jgi:hypothetical protein
LTSSPTTNLQRRPATASSSHSINHFRLFAGINRFVQHIYSNYYDLAFASCTFFLWRYSGVWYYTNDAQKEGLSTLSMERNGIIHKTTKEGLAFSVRLIKRDTSDVATQLFASAISFRRFGSKVSPHVEWSRLYGFGRFWSSHVPAYVWKLLVSTYGVTCCVLSLVSLPRAMKERREILRWDWECDG